MFHADLKQVFPSLQQNNFKTGDALLSRRMLKDLVCDSACVELLHYSNQIYFSLKITIPRAVLSPSGNRHGKNRTRLCVCVCATIFVFI